jgi:hypothetical protein
MQDTSFQKLKPKIHELNLADMDERDEFSAFEYHKNGGVSHSSEILTTRSIRKEVMPPQRPNDDPSPPPKSNSISPVREEQMIELLCHRMENRKLELYSSNN